MKKKKSDEKKSQKRKVHEGIRSTLYNPVTVPLLDLNMSDKLKPLLQATTPRPQLLDLLDSNTPTYEQSRFGLVPYGCTLAGQHPERHPIAPGVIPDFALKELPLYGHEDLDENQTIFFEGMKLPLAECEEIERMTREQSHCNK